jgi:hypothetical protein
MTSSIALFQVNVNAFRATASRDFTKNDFCNLCSMLKSVFDNKYEFEPQAISEGGIVFANLEADQFKSMKLYGITHSGTYGWIKKGETILEWKDNNEVLCVKDYVLTGNIRAFNYLKWTREEINLFAKCLMEFGFTIEMLEFTDEELSGYEEYYLNFFMKQFKK